MLFGALVLVGALVIRHMVINKISSRAFASAAVVLSRPFIISEDQNVFDLKLSSRLKRLSYSRVEGLPEKPGQYSRASSKWHVFLRKFQLPTGAIQEATNAEIKLSDGGDIIQIK